MTKIKTQKKGTPPKITKAQIDQVKKILGDGFILVYENGNYTHVITNGATGVQMIDYTAHMIDVVKEHFDPIGLRLIAHARSK